MFDIVLLVFLLIGFMWGWSKGFLAQLISLVGAVLGFLVACFLYGNLGDFLAPKIGTSPTMGHIIAFFLIWFCVPLACSWLGKGFVRIMKKLKLGWINSILGGAFSLFKMLLFLSVLLTFLEFIDKYKAEPIVDVETKESSVLYYSVQKFAGKLLPSDFLERNTTDPAENTTRI